MARPKKKTTGKGFAEIKRKKRKPTIYKMEEIAATKGTRVLPRTQQLRIARREARRKARRISGKRAVGVSAAAAKQREILIVSRKGQPQIFAEVEALEKRNYPPTSVSSSWISTIGYFYNEKMGTFTTKTGRQYKIYNFPFEEFEKWYYAHSKGTYFNEFIKDQYENNIKGTL